MLTNWEWHLFECVCYAIIRWTSIAAISDKKQSIPFETSPIFTNIIWKYQSQNKRAFPQKMINLKLILGQLSFCISFKITFYKYLHCRGFVLIIQIRDKLFILIFCILTFVCNLTFTFFLIIFLEKLFVYIFYHLFKKAVTVFIQFCYDDLWSSCYKLL